MYLLGITIVISGQYTNWNYGFNAGVYGYLIAYVIVGLAYVVLCACMSEVSSVLPFAGGIYGLARCTLGFYPAFIIGCCETLEYIAGVATIVINLVDQMAEMAPQIRDLKPFFWLLVYLASIMPQVQGPRMFWVVNWCLGATTLFFLLVYCIGVSPALKSSAYGENVVGSEFQGGFLGLIQSFPFAAWFFLGVEALNFTSDDLEYPKQDIPPAQMPCVLTLFVTGLWVFAVTLGLKLPEGLSELKNEAAPLNTGFQSFLPVSTNIVTMISLLSLYSAIFGLMWAYGKILCHMSSSRLLPTFVMQLTDRHGAFAVALLAGSLIGYVMCLIVYFAPSLQDHVFSVCLMFAFLSYLGHFTEGSISRLTKWCIPKPLWHPWSRVCQHRMGLWADLSVWFSERWRH